MRDPKSNRTTALLIGCVATVALTTPLAGQLPSGDASRSESGERIAPLLWSRTSQEDRVLWGMSTLHLHHLDWGLSNDQLIGVIWRGAYAATFINTHDRRTYTIGMERDWLSGSVRPLHGMLGFRTGLVYGYDRQLGWMAQRYPVLPFAQPVAYLRLGAFTVDAAYTWVVVSFTGGLRF